MSTPALIVAKMSDGKYGAIYCHYDGYPLWTLTVLEKDYRSQPKIDELISSGDLSYIECELPNCRFYGGESNQAYFNTDASLAKRFSGKPPVSYGYFWDGLSWEQFTPYKKRKN